MYLNGLPDFSAYARLIKRKCLTKRPHIAPPPKAYRTASFCSSRLALSAPSYSVKSSIHNCLEKQASHHASKSPSSSVAKTSRFASWLVVLLAFLVSILVSVGVGMVSRRADLALATMGTVAAWIACFEGALLLCSPLHPKDSFG